MKSAKRTTEKEWNRLAVEGREGRPIERKDAPPAHWERVSPPIYLLAFAFAFSGLLGSVIPEIRAEHWQSLMSCIILTAIAQGGSLSLMHPINSRPGYAVALLNLPISGENIVRWIRWKFWLGRAPLALLFCGVASLAAYDFDFSATVWIVASALLLTATTFSTMILLNDEWFQRLRIRWIWGMLIVSLTIWIAVLCYFKREIFYLGNTPDWLVSAILRFTWIFPPSWCLPGRFENGGALLTLPWIAAGAIRWNSWPKRAGHQLDTLQDITTAKADHDETGQDPVTNGVDQWDVNSATNMGTESIGEIRDREWISLPDPLEMVGKGWVEQWVRECVGPKNTWLAGALGQLSPNWTRQTNLVILLAPPVLILIWIFHRYFPEIPVKDTVRLWVCIIPFALSVAALLPTSNEVPRATASGVVGGQIFLTFSMLPVSVHDVLRISMRITFARCVIMLPLMTAIVAALLAIFDDLEFSPWNACWMVAVATYFRLISQPVFLCHQFRKASRRCNSLAQHAAFEFLTMVAALGWLSAPAVAVISALGLFSIPQSEIGIPLLVTIGGLLVSGLCARAVFEIHYWKLKMRQIDWLLPLH